MHPYISSLTIFLALTMTYRNWSINRNSVFLSGFLIIFSLYALIHYVLMISKNVYLLAIFYNNNAPLGFLAGPLLYLYVRGTIDDKIRLDKKDFLHLLPACINLVSITPYVLTPFSYKLQLANLLAKDTMVAKTFNVGLYPNIVNIIARTSLLLTYTVAAYIILFRYYLKIKRGNQIHQTQTRFMIIWLSTFVTIIFFTVIVFVVMSYLFLKEPNPDLTYLSNGTPMNIVGICLLLIPCCLITFPEILYGIPAVSRTNNSRIKKQISDANQNGILIQIKHDLASDTKSNSTENVTQLIVDEAIDVDAKFIELSQEVLDYINSSKIYTNPNFSMETLSVAMDIPKHHLYYCFNTVLNIRLTKIRAQLRVDYVKKLLNEGVSESITLDAIGNQAGFSSRSSFQSTFKDEVGCTPGEYLKACNQSKE